MKRRISLFLGVLFSLICFCACEVGSSGKHGNNSGSGNSSSEVSDFSSDISDGEEDELNENSYTVTLSYQGSTFIPANDTYAQWTKITETGDITGYQRSSFNEEGIAFRNGLDGEYRVTLGNLPDGYAYNPNLYVASGNSRNVVVELYPIIQTTKSGTDWYGNVIKISQVGIYRVTIPTLFAVKDGVCFEFSIPMDGGVYGVQSIVDVMQDTINPIAEIYVGSSAYKTWSYTCDGGVEFENGSYTKNFYFEGQASSDQEGHGIIPFAVRATTTDGTFPLTVDFLISRKDDCPPEDVSAEMIHAKECPTESAPEGVGTWVGAETRKNGQMIFDGANYVYNEEDGFYHVGTKDGPYLYVDLATSCRFFPLHYPSPGEGYVPGIAWSFVTAERTLPTAFLRVAELDRTTGERTGRLIYYKPMIEEEYSAVCNSDGRCLVTEELKWFLQEIAESKGYFHDGYGWVETYSVDVCGYSVSALEDDQWLFACGYYVPGGETN